MRGLGLAAAALLAIGGLGAAPAAAYDRLYVFGDSLVDSGNAKALAPDKVPTPNGRFTNGLNFADDLARALGFGAATAYLDPTSSSGTNYSVGGAKAVFSLTAGSPDLGTQIRGLPGVYTNDYRTSVLTGKRPAIDAASLVLVTIGGNDIRDAAAANPDAAQFATQVGNVVRSNLTTLYAAGARNIVLTGVPDIGIIPEKFGTGEQAAASALSTALNLEYQRIGSEYGALLAGQGSFQFVGLANLQAGLAANPAIDPKLLTKGCVPSGGLAVGCAGYAYFDNIHPTAVVHQLIADAIVAQLPEPASWGMMILGFGLIGTAMRRRPAAPALG